MTLAKVKDLELGYVDDTAKNEFINRFGRLTDAVYTAWITPWNTRFITRESNYWTNPHKINLDFWIEVRNSKKEEKRYNCKTRTVNAPLAGTVETMLEGNPHSMKKYYILIDFEFTFSVYYENVFDNCEIKLDASFLTNVKTYDAAMKAIKRHM